jgi:hypothetical protein
VYATFPIAFGSTADFNDPRQEDRAFLFGPYILVARSAYDAVGGHAGVRGEICEDMELALLLKRAGRFRTVFADGRMLASVRPYRSLGEIWLGFTKNSVTGARGSAARIVLAAVLTLALSVLPWAACVVALTRGQAWEAVEALASSAVVIGMVAWSLSKMGQPMRLALYQPVGFVMIAVIAIASLMKVVSGRGVEWRGRRYTGRYKAALP